MTQAHHERKHAAWSASATARNWQCHGALAMASLAGEEKESIYAAQGTAAHEISERCLRDTTRQLVPAAFIGQTIKTKEFEIEIDEELADSASVYVDYVRSLPADDLLIELHGTLETLDPPFEAGGTCDAIALMWKAETVEVIDFKNGRGVVAAAENKQLRTYALTVMLTLAPEQLRRIKKIKSTIVQPRAAGEAIRSETYTLGELIAWTTELLDRMELAAQAEREFRENEGNRVKFDEWAEKWLTPGNCTFCPAEGFCPKLRSQALGITPKDVQKWFEDPDAGAFPAIGNSVKIDDPEELGHILDGLSQLEDWISAIRAHAHKCAEAGNPPKGWMLADKIGNRAWEQSDVDAHVADMIKLGFTLGDVYLNKIRSPAQMEQVAGAKRKALLAPYIHRPKKGVNLVSCSKTTREAAPSTVERFFEKTEK